MVRPPGAPGAHALHAQKTICGFVSQTGLAIALEVEGVEFKEGTMSRNIEHLDERLAGVLKPGSAASTTHLTLQGKGGVGKSSVASILAQYCRHHGREIHCIESDPVNQTFSQYAELGAEHLALMREGRIDSGGFGIFFHRLINEEVWCIVGLADARRDSPMAQTSPTGPILSARTPAFSLRAGADVDPGGDT